MKVYVLQSMIKAIFSHIFPTLDIICEWSLKKARASKADLSGELVRTQSDGRSRGGKEGRKQERVLCGRAGLENFCIG